MPPAWMTACSQPLGTGGSASLPDGGAEHKKGRREGRRVPKKRNSKEPRPVEIKDAALRDMLAVIIKQLAINTRQIREMRGMLLDVYVMESSHQVAKLVRGGGAAYAQTVAKDGKGHGLGPPSVTVGTHLVKGLAEMDCGQLNRTKLGEVINKFEQTEDVWEVHQLFLVARLEKCFVEDKVKLVLGIGDPQIKLTIRQALIQVGVQGTVGQAPAGHLEEELQAYIEMLEI